MRIHSFSELKRFKHPTLITNNLMNSTTKK
jgi:hypothetical protein